MPGDKCLKSSLIAGVAGYLPLRYLLLRLGEECSDGFLMKVVRECGNLFAGSLVYLVEESLLCVKELTLDQQVCGRDFLAYDVGGLFFNLRICRKLDRLGTLCRGSQDLVRISPGLGIEFLRFSLCFFPDIPDKRFQA